MFCFIWHKVTLFCFFTKQTVIIFYFDRVKYC